jgi:5-hydroxyisourate hydrolase
MKDPGVSFHRLPSSVERKRQWLAAFDVTEEEWCTHWRVCSRHFPDGNPKAAPHSYQEDQFATMWSLRKRAKLDGSRAVVSPARQSKMNNHLNSILALRVTHGAISHPFPVINTTAGVAGVTTSSGSTEERKPLHARAPPVLLPVASLSTNHHLMGGPITVITRDPLNQHGRVVPVSHYHHNHGGIPGGIHVHKLVVMPEVGPSTDEASSDSSGTDESPMTGASDVTGKGLSATMELNTHNHKRGSHNDGVDHGLVDHQELRGENSVNHGTDSGASPSHAGSSETPLLRVNHVISSSSHARTVSRVDRTVPMTCHAVSITDHANIVPAVTRGEHANRPPGAIAGGSGGGEGHNVSVVVQSALLAHMAALENDNQQLRQTVSSSPSTVPPLLGVHVTDSTTGRPAEGLSLEVGVWQSSSGDWMTLGSGVTGGDGDCSPLPSQPQLSPGLYRLHFDTQSYFTSQGHSQPHYPYVEVVFRIYRATPCHRVSLQLSPFSYATSSHTH